jgi:formamidopyrimidine-DNA glycosylase
LAGQPEIMIMTRFFNEKIGDLDVCEVKSSPAKRVKDDFSRLAGKKWKVHSISRGKEAKLVFTNGEETHELLLHYFKGGNWAWAPSFEELHPSLNFEKDHRFSLYMEDGSVMVHYDKFHQSHWKWGNWGYYRSPDVVLEHNAFRKYMYDMRNHHYMSQPVYTVMMHPRFFNGFNNLIRCEILARTRFSPFTTMKEILSSEILREDLFEVSKYVIEELYRAGGAQMGIWVNPYGSTKEALIRFISVYRSWKPNHFYFMDTPERVMYVHNRWKNEYTLKQLKIEDDEIHDGSNAGDDI